MSAPRLRAARRLVTKPAGQRHRRAVDAQRHDPFAEVRGAATRRATRAATGHGRCRGAGRTSRTPGPRRRASSAAPRRRPAAAGTIAPGEYVVYQLGAARLASTPAGPTRTNGRPVASSTSSVRPVRFSITSCVPIVRCTSTRMPVSGAGNGSSAARTNAWPSRTPGRRWTRGGGSRPHRACEKAYASGVPAVRARARRQPSVQLASAPSTITGFDTDGTRPLLVERLTNSM